MRLVDFLIHTLEAHGNTLRDLSALVGKEELFEILENAGEAAENSKNLRTANSLKEDLEAPKPKLAASYPYAELSSKVMEMRLVPMLEFHIWAYPFYRTLIEADLDLSGEIKKATLESWIERATQAAEAWIKTLALPVNLSRKADQISKSCWLRFRTQCLKQSGRPFLSRVS